MDNNDTDLEQESNGQQLGENESQQPSFGNVWASRNSSQPPEKSPAEIQKEKEKDASGKLGALGARGVADYFTGGKYENIRNAPIVGKVAQKAEKKVGETVSKVDSLTGRRIGKKAKKLDDAGVLDAADKLGGAIGGAKGGNPGAQPGKMGGNQFKAGNSGPTTPDTGIQKKGSVSQASMQSAQQSVPGGVEDGAGTTSKQTASSDDTSGKKEKGKVDSKNHEGSSDETIKGEKEGIKKFLLRPFIIILLLSLPFILFMMLILLVILMVVGGNFDVDGSANAVANGSQCKSEVSVSGGTSIDTRGLRVELVNCFAKESDYKVLTTLDFDKYVLGVALAEIGPDTSDEAIKAQIIASRNFALTRSGGKDTGMCPGNYNSCFYGYNANSKVIRMRACENDQVYWDYTKDIYRQATATKGVAKYSPEITSGRVWKPALSSSRIAEVEALAEQVKGDTLVDGSGNLVETGFNSTTSDKFINYADMGRSYDEILDKVYGGKISKSKCDGSESDGSSSGGTGSSGVTSFNNSSSNVLQEPLSSFLSKKGSSVQEFNNTISNNVNKAGWGTRQGVVAAATTLISELNDKYGVRINYFWGGGHSGQSTLADGNWGNTGCDAYANGKHYNRCGLDCSGFVGWAIYNGGYRNITTLAQSYYTVNGTTRVELNNSPLLRPGDLMYSSGHVVMIVGVDSANSKYIVAEAAGLDYGVLFSKKDYNPSGYTGLDMTAFYENSSNVRGR